MFDEKGQKSPKTGPSVGQSRPNLAPTRSHAQEFCLRAPKGVTAELKFVNLSKISWAARKVVSCGRDPGSERDGEAQAGTLSALAAEKRSWTSEEWQFQALQADAGGQVCCSGTTSRRKYSGGGVC